MLNVLALILAGLGLAETEQMSPDWVSMTHARDRPRPSLLPVQLSPPPTHTGHRQTMSRRQADTTQMTFNDVWRHSVIESTVRAYTGMWYHRVRDRRQNKHLQVSPLALTNFTSYPEQRTTIRTSARFMLLDKHMLKSV